MRIVVQLTSATETWGARTGARVRLHLLAARCGVRHAREEGVARAARRVARSTGAWGVRHHRCRNGRRIAATLRDRQRLAQAVRVDRCATNANAARVRVECRRLSGMRASQRPVGPLKFNGKLL